MIDGLSPVDYDNPSGPNGSSFGWLPLAADSSRTLAENFFKSLPAMSFTEAEEALRDAILCFLENWVEEVPGSRAPGEVLGDFFWRISVSFTRFFPPHKT